MFTFAAREDMQAGRLCAASSTPRITQSVQESLRGFRLDADEGAVKFIDLQLPRL